MGKSKYILKLNLFEGDQFQKTLEFEEDIIKIGKMASSHLKLDDDQLSRMHAVIEVVGSEVHVLDLGSTKGTFVNGKKINKQKIVSKDEIVVGKTRIVIDIIEKAGVLPAGASTEATTPPEKTFPAPLAPVKETLSPPPEKEALPAARFELKDPFSTLKPKELVKPVEFKMNLEDLKSPEEVERIKINERIFQALPMVYQTPLKSMDVQSNYTGVGERALEVTNYWMDSAIESVKFDKSTPVVLIGETNKVRFFVPIGDLLNTPEFALIDRNTLCFSDKMKVEVQTGNDFQTGQALIDSRKASSVGDGIYSLPITDNFTAKVDIGYNSFIINTIEEPQVTAVGSPFSLAKIVTLVVIFIISAFIHTVFVGLGFFIPPESKDILLDRMMGESRFIKVGGIKPDMDEEIEAEKNLKDDVKKDAGKVAQAHKGKEGKAGSPEVDPALKGKMGIQGPKDSKELKIAAREKAMSEGIHRVLSDFGGTQISSIFGEGTESIGSDVQNVWGNLTGSNVGSGYGSYGFGLRGTGRGGGGFGLHTLGVGKFGPKGRGGFGGRGGTGPGSGYRDGIGSLQERGRRIPDVYQGAITSLGGLDRETIRRYIRMRMGQIKYCYESELLKKKDLYGKLEIGFTITPLGSVIGAFIKATTMNNSNVESCVVGIFSRIQFPKPKGGGKVIVSYPIFFRSL